MIGDIKAVVEIVQSLFGLRSAERARTADLLNQMSQEVNDLSKAWSEVAVIIENGEAVTTSWIRDRMLQQRPHFSAVETFERYLDDRYRALRGPPFEHEDGGWYPRRISKPELISAFGSELTVRLWKAFQLGVGEKNSMYSLIWEIEKGERDRAELSAELSAHAATLAGVAGELKTITAMYRAGISR